MNRLLSILTITSLVAAAGCSSNDADDATQPVELGGDILPAAEQAPAETMGDEQSAASARQGVRAMAVVDADGQLAIVDSNGGVSNAWVKFSALVAPDETMAVLSLPPKTARTLAYTELAWASLPGGEQVGRLTVQGIVTEATATSIDGELVALTSLADEPIDGAIAGARDGTNVLIASRTDGVLYTTGLDGNFMAEAFSQRLTAAGIPAQVFLLEYLPADAPTYYQVRVLSTETGEISPPLNLRDKSVTLDQQMPGYSRSHVVADEHGLLFTLYVGAGDPEAEHPFAFVHTLDFADGVWCLDVDPQLDLGNEPGSLVVGGDRLYVASANGWVGSFMIPSITDPNLSPTMDWVTQVAPAGTTAPAITADDDGVHLSFDDETSQLFHIRSDGTPGGSIELDGVDAQAMTITADGEVVAIGHDWITRTGDFHRPDWLDDISRLIISSDSAG